MQPGSWVTIIVLRYTSDTTALSTEDEDNVVLIASEMPMLRRMIRC
jgi:hypothetical protein